MRLDSVAIRHFRNINVAEIGGFGDFNFIYGLNGSGKTSLLEAIYTLSVSHSFRSRKVKSLVSHGHDALVVRGRVDQGGGRSYTLAVQRSMRTGTIVKHQAQRLTSAGEMAGLFPVQVVNPDSFSLVEGAPSQRRQFLDWAVFHVKHYRFYTLWSRYKKAMQQRNSLLRRGKIDRSLLAAWEAEMAATGDEITAYRRQEFSKLRAEFDSIYRQLAVSFNPPDMREGKDAPIDDGGGGDGRGGGDADYPVIELKFLTGWDGVESSGLAEALSKSYQGDLRRGLTRYGPHRADIEIRVAGAAASEILSRGQIKTLVCALKIAQCRVMTQGGVYPVLLLDDLPAELDRHRRAALFQTLQSLGVQVFATSIERRDLDKAWCGDYEVKRFHVKHGVVEIG